MNTRCRHCVLDPQSLKMTVFAFGFALFPCSIQAAFAQTARDSNHHYPVRREFWRELSDDLKSLEGEWFQQQYMTGNWGDLRERLGKWGIMPTVNYVTDLLGHPVGGRRQGFQYTGYLAVDLRADLEQLWGLTGLIFNVSGSWLAGGDLSARSIGNVFTASNLFDGETARSAVHHQSQR